jgi:hypothetical protein
MNYILAVKLEIRARAGHHNYVAIDVRDIYFAGSLALTNQAFCSPYGVERTIGSSYRLLLLFNKNRWP